MADDELEPELDPGSQEADPEPAPKAEPTAKPKKRYTPQRAPKAKVSAAPGPLEDDTTAGSAAGEPNGAQPGSATDRQAWLEEADSVFVRGDVVGGSKYVYHLGDRLDRREPMQPVSPLLVEPAREAFAPPPNWLNLTDAFLRRRAHLLMAVRGSGRPTLAIRLLIDSSFTRILLLDHDLDLRQLADLLQSDPEESGTDVRGAGLLLIEPAGAISLAGRELQHLEHLLEENDARLVVITDADHRLLDEEALEHRLPFDGPPVLTEVFEANLRWRIGHHADQVLASPDVEAAVEELLQGEQPVHRAAYLATYFQMEEKDGEVDLAAVRERMAKRDANDFSIWLDGLTDRNDMPFALALAVLNAMPFEAVREAARKLAERCGGERSSGSGYRQRLRDFRAGSGQMYARNGSFGRVVEDSIEYVDDTYPRRVIEFIWKRGSANEEILAWLLDLAADPDSHPRTRIRASAALGVLAIDNFDHMHSKLFDPWSKDDDEYRREAAANALRIPAGEDRTAANVHRLIEKWHGGIWATPQTQATAARAYGVTLRRSDPDWLIERLGRLSVVPDLEVQRSVGESMSDLVARSDGRHAQAVLGALCAWLPNHRRERAAVEGFLTAALSLLAETNEDPDDGVPPSWPTLLLLADGDPVIRSALSHLWAHVLNGWGFSTTSRRILTEWAQMAEKNRQMRLVLGYLLTAVAQYDSRTHQIVVEILGKWADPDNLQPLDVTAAEITSRLSRIAGPVLERVG